MNKNRMRDAAEFDRQRRESPSNLCSMCQHGTTKFVRCMTCNGYFCVHMFREHSHATSKIAATNEGNKI